LISEPSEALLPLVVADDDAAVVVAPDPPAVVVAPPAAAVVAAAVVAPPLELLELSLPQAAAVITSAALQNATPSRKLVLRRPTASSPSAPTARTLRRTLMWNSPL
jgi:hypothetical protein